MDGGRTYGLARLLSAKSIAIIGGGAWGAAIIGAARRVGFQGEIALVHPKGKEVAGAVSCTALRDVPWPIDAAFVAVNRRATVDVVAELAALGAGGAVCFASGFAEALAEAADGADLQAQLVAAAGDMPILGPNCYGFLNALDGVGIWPDQHGMQPVERGVAILTQSSNIAINLTQQARALPIGYMITCGNQAQTSQADLAAAVLEDPRVTAIGLHIEGFGDIAAWDQFARKAHARGVPVVALKAGRSVQAQRATVSHTASLAGSDAGARALMTRFGFSQVEDLPTLLETLRLLHMYGRLDSASLSSISCSGGEASLAADLAQDRAVDLPDLTEAQRGALRQALGPMVALANPLDYHTYIWRDADAMSKAWRAMAADHIGLTFSVVDYPRTDASDWACATQAALRVRAETGRPFAMVATLPELMPEDVATQLMEGGVVPMFGLRELLVAAELAAETCGMEEAPPVIPATDLGDIILMDEGAAKQALAAFGVEVPKSVEGEREGDWTGIALTAPLAVKGVGLAHKSDVGAVRLGVVLSDLAEVIAAMPTERVLVEEMVPGAIIELLVGVTRDPAHGFVLTIGAGGVWTEIMQDTVSFIVPTARNTIARGLDRLKIAPVLRGYRGRPGVDLAAVLDAIMAVQRYVVDHAATLDEIEINPLIATPTRAVAVDALIRKTTPAQGAKHERSDKDPA